MVMLTRVRAWWVVYGRLLEVILLALMLLGVGAFAGFLAAAERFAAEVAEIRAAHVEEIDRIQRVNERAMSALIGRVEAVSSRQANTADKVESAATTAQRAAATAQGAAQNAARAAIRERKP